MSVGEGEGMKGNIGCLLYSIVVVFFLALIHVINWLLTKGTIWVAYELFQIDWRDKFWVVYVLLIVLGSIFKSTVSVKK